MCVCVWLLFLCAFIYILLLVLWLLLLHRRRHDDTNARRRTCTLDILCSLYVGLTTFLSSFFFLPSIVLPIPTLTKCNNILNYRYYCINLKSCREEKKVEKKHTKNNNKKIKTPRSLRYMHSNRIAEVALRFYFKLIL